MSIGGKPDLAIHSPQAEIAIEHKKKNRKIIVGFTNANVSLIGLLIAALQYSSNNQDNN